MKKLFLAITISLSVAVAANAQKKTTGAIQFETTADPAVIASGTGMQISDEMRARMPKSIKTNFELLFTPTNASYMPVEDTEDSNSGGGGGGMGRMMMRFGGAGGNREYFYNFADKSISEVFDLSDTTYLIKSKLSLSAPVQFAAGGNFNGNSAVQASNEPPVIEAVKSDETKTIIGFLCNKVTIKSTRKVKILDLDREVTEETVLWYTKDLGFDFSPNPIMWTEGAVLAVEGRGTSTVAKSISFRNVSAKDVTPPKKALEITQTQYQEKMANMMRRNRGNNNGGARQGGQQPVRNIIIN